MLKSALLAVGLVTSAITAASAQGYYSYPDYYGSSVYSADSYPYGYSAYYGWPYSGYYYYPTNRTPPSYADPYVYARPYSDGAGPAPN